MTGGQPPNPSPDSPAESDESARSADGPDFTDLDEQNRQLRDNLADKRWDKYLGRQKASPLVFATAGIELVGLVGGLTLLGWWVDGALGTLPTLTVVGLTIGTIGGLYRLYQRGKPFFQQSKKDAPSNKHKS